MSKWKRGPYNDRFRQEDPVAAAPKTTRWRLLKNKKKPDYKSLDADENSSSAIDSDATGTSRNFQAVEHSLHFHFAVESEKSDDVFANTTCTDNIVDKHHLCHQSDESPSPARMSSVVNEEKVIDYENDVDECNSVVGGDDVESVQSTSEDSDDVDSVQWASDEDNDVNMVDGTQQDHQADNEDGSNSNTVQRLDDHYPALQANDSPMSSPSRLYLETMIERLSWNETGDTNMLDMLKEDDNPNLLAFNGDDNLFLEDEEEDAEEDNGPGENKDLQDDEPSLYEGSQITISESALLTLTFALRHGLSGECLADMLKLIELHCPAENSCNTSLYQLRNHFSGLTSPLKFHQFCSSCDMFIGSKEVAKCPNNSCGKVFENDKQLPFFVEIPIEEQIKNLFNRPNFHEDLLQRFTLNSDKNVISDIYDGTLYKKYCKPGKFLSNPNNISLMWYVDGAQLFKSSKGSLWVIYFAINELPKNKRMNGDNIILGGLWFNEGKPCMSSYLKPFSESLERLYKSGFDVDCNHCSEHFNVKAVLLCGTCDLPAKASVMNMTQFNGEFGCSNCQQPGLVVAAGRGHTRVFPFDQDNIDGPRRTHQETIKHGIEAGFIGKHVQGIKGLSWFVSLDCDLIEGTAIDYMHGVLLGVTRQLLRMWFETKHHNESFSISRYVDLVDKKLLSIKPPNFISRLPRSIKQHMAYWKANELRAWLLYYSVPVLCGILPSDLYQHHLLLVESIYTLSSENITHEGLMHCRYVLIHYCSVFSALYSDRHMTMNIHQLLHLADCVQALGPLWVYSCFSFEGLNGKLLKLVHGANKPVVQIANAVSYTLRIPEFGLKLRNGSKSLYLYNRLRTKAKYSSGVVIADGVTAIGKYVSTTDQEIVSLVQGTGYNTRSISSFQRAIIHGVLVCSNRYSAMKSRISSVVILKDGTFASVELFLKLSTGSCSSSTSSCILNSKECNCSNTYLAVVKRMVVASCTEVGLCRDDLTSVSLPHVQLVKRKCDEMVQVPISDIKDVCVYMSVPLANDLPALEFITVPPNHIEGD